MDICNICILVCCTGLKQSMLKSASPVLPPFLFSPLILDLECACASHFIDALVLNGDCGMKFKSNIPEFSPAYLFVMHSAHGFCWEFGFNAQGGGFFLKQRFFCLRHAEKNHLKIYVLYKI